MRISCIAICHPPSFFNIVWPVVKVFFGSRLRKRMFLAGGGVHHDDEAAVQKLKEKVGLTPEQIPQLIGGTLHLTPDDWLMTTTAK